VGYYWPKGHPLPKVGRIVTEDDAASEGSEV
jgi:hypothetical protein